MKFVVWEGGLVMQEVRELGMIQDARTDVGPIGSTDVLFPVVYGELKRIARRYLRASGARVTVCTTEVVHEAFLRLSKREGMTWESRAHFFGSAARAMRQVLVDYARRRQARKRQATPISLSLADSERALEVEFDEIIAVDDALSQLDALNPRLRQIVELRFFAGIPESEIAAMLSVSVRTVERDWLKARMFLVRELRASQS